MLIARLQTGYKFPLVEGRQVIPSPRSILKLPIDFQKIITIIESSKRFDYPLR